MISAPLTERSLFSLPPDSDSGVTLGGPSPVQPAAGALPPAVMDELVGGVMDRSLPKSLGSDTPADYTTQLPESASGAAAAGKPIALTGRRYDKLARNVDDQMEVLEKVNQLLGRSRA